MSEDGFKKGKVSILPVGILSSYHISVMMGKNREAIWKEVRLAFELLLPHTGVDGHCVVLRVQITWPRISPRSISTANSGQRMSGQASVRYPLLIQSQVTEGINVTAKKLNPDDP